MGKINVVYYYRTIRRHSVLVFPGGESGNNGGEMQNLAKIGGSM